MPASSEQNGVPLFIIFLAMKMTGYCFSVIPLSNVFQRPEMKRWFKILLFGFTRLCLGAMIALSTASIMNYFHIDRALAVYLGIYPLRVAEWYLLLWFCFDYQMTNAAKLLRWALIAGVYSYLLDLIAVGIALLVGKFLL